MEFRWDISFISLRNALKTLVGWVAERLKAPVLKTGKPERVSWVRIPPHPPFASAKASAELRRRMSRRSFSEGGPFHTLRPCS